MHFFHNNNDLKNSEKVQYLASSLVGATKDSTKQFTFVASSYPTIVQYLETMYDNPVNLRSTYANTITSMIADPSIEGMRKNLDNLVDYLKNPLKFDPNQAQEHFLGYVLEFHSIMIL